MSDVINIRIPGLFIIGLVGACLIVGPAFGDTSGFIGGIAEKQIVFAPVRVFVGAWLILLAGLGFQRPPRF